jgi:hypothetical protein
VGNPDQGARHLPGERLNELTDWGRQALLQTARWLPDRRIVAVADSSFFVIELPRAVRAHLDVVALLLLDAGLNEPPPLPQAATCGGQGSHPPTLARPLPEPAGVRLSCAGTCPGQTSAGRIDCVSFAWRSRPDPQ